MTNLAKHVMPGETGGDTSWFERLNSFEQQETMRQVAYKRKHWPALPDGVWSKRPTYTYPHIMPAGNEARVFFDDFAESVVGYLGDEDIALHTEALNLRSSQVCCLNFIFPLKKDPGLAVRILYPLLPGLMSIASIDFEYTGPDGATQWLGEPSTGKKGQNRTSIDAAIFWRDQTGRDRVTLVEWKYTERSFGSCGGYESDGNKQKGLCQTLDVRKANPAAKCYLTSGGDKTSRKYWEHMREAGINLSKLPTNIGCPFRGPFYQLMRQTLLAQYIRGKEHSRLVDIAVIAFSENRQLLRSPSKEGSVLNSWNAALDTMKVPMIRLVTAEAIASAAGQAVPIDNPWRLYLRERYGV